MSCSAVGYPLKEVQRQDDIIRALWLGCSVVAHADSALVTCMAWHCIAYARYHFVPYLKN